MTIKLIIGLGNPDEQYKETRHNVGFMMVDYIAKKGDFSAKGGPVFSWELNKNLNSLITKCKIDGTSMILAKPQTYVNKSGEAVKKLATSYKLQANQLIVIQDDLDIPFGNTRISFDKNSGGHKGIESIIKALKTKKFYRLRIGLAKPALQKARQQSDKKRDEFVVNYVLSKFSKNEAETLKHLLKESYDKLLSILG